MHTKILVTLLSLVFATSTHALQCYDNATSRTFDKYKLIGNPYYILLSNDPSYGQGCYYFEFQRSNAEIYKVDMVVTIHHAQQPVANDKIMKEMYMQYLAEGQYRLWNTSEEDFDPTKPGDVEEIGRATFTAFESVLGLQTTNLFVVNFCYTTVNYQFSAFSSGIRIDASMIVDKFKALGVTVPLVKATCFIG